MTTFFRTAKIQRIIKQTPSAVVFEDDKNLFISKQVLNLNLLTMTVGDTIHLECAESRKPSAGYGSMLKPLLFFNSRIQSMPSNF